MDFYPRPPGGGRPRIFINSSSQSKFLSTPSGWRATLLPPSSHVGFAISIHALRVEGDGDVVQFSGGPHYDFYPRPPGGGRPTDCRYLGHGAGISIHALRVEGDS